MALDPGTSEEYRIYFDEKAISQIAWSNDNKDSGTVTENGSSYACFMNGYEVNHYFTAALNAGYEITAVAVGGTEIELTSETTFEFDSSEINGDITITTKATTTDDTDTDDEGDEQNESSGGGYIYE